MCGTLLAALIPESATSLCCPAVVEKDGLRLVDGGSNATHTWGRLELFNNSLWGSVCDSSFDLNDATVGLPDASYGS